MPSTTPPTPTHILETCLYVRDMTDAVRFYTEILHLKPDVSSPRLTMFPLGNTSLILFQLGSTEADSITTNSHTGATLTIPGHGPDQAIVNVLLDSKANANTAETIENESSAPEAEQLRLRTHYCLAVNSTDDVIAWEEHFKAHNVRVRGVMEWAKGGRSVYFEDHDGHVGEIGSRGIWNHW